jgi:Heterokaryon incompatibility protein (HET)
MASFQYSPLRDIKDLGFEHGECRRTQPELLVDGEWEIRLIQLLPSKSRDAAVECTLLPKTFKLAKGGYEALSYVWKDTCGIEGVYQQPPDIIVNGYYFPVTRNLQAALIRLRDKNRDRILWVDQICINQEDIHERSTQVERMTLIYGFAQRTVIWLGEEKDESYRAMLLLRGLSRVAKGQNQETILDVAVHEFSNNSRWAALDLLLKRAWWQRTWIIQECAMARDIILMCGYRDLPWADLINAATIVERLIEKKVMWQSISKVSVSGINALQRSRMRVAVRGDHDIPALPHKGSDNILEVLSRYRTSQATDPRDKVYALLHLARDSRQAASEGSFDPIPVDYARSVESVYHDVAKFLLASTDRLDFLSYCRSKRKVSGLPSWIPDWSDTDREPHPFLGSYSVTGSSSAIAHINGLRLTARGFQFDCVRILGDACKDSDFSRVSPSPTFQQWKELALDSCKSNGVQQHQEDDFIRTLTSDRIRNNRLNDTTLLLFREAYRIWDARVSNEECNATSGARFGDLFQTLDFFYSLQRATSKRRFFISEMGFMGLAPEDTQEKNLLVAFLGATLPFAVRKLKEDEYVMIGEW